MVVEVTENFIHVRVKDPKKCDFIRYARRGRGIAALSKKGVRLKVCCPKGEATARDRCKVGMTTQAVVYDKDKWTKRKAVTHSKKFR